MCREFWRFTQAYGRVFLSLWEIVAAPWRWCTAQPCTWWCLCCNRWLCWIVLIAVAHLLLVLYLMFVITMFVILVFCESLCILLAIITAVRGPAVRCFQYSDLPTPPAQPVNQPPVARTNGPYNGIVGQAIQMSAAGSTDPEGATLFATWDFGDGAIGSGLSTNHAYVNVGTYTVTVSVSDGSLSSTAVTTANIVGIGGWNPNDPTDQM